MTWTVFGLVPERYRSAHEAGMARMRDTGKANILGQRIEIEAIRKNGEEFMSELAISRSRSSSGEIFIAYIRDITDSKAAAKALLDAKEAAELANRAKTQFISAMSHEIRTPFNAVLGIFDILGEGQLTPDQKQLIGTAERTSRSLLRIINDVLDYARISSGSVKVVNDAFHAPDVFDDVYRLFAMQAKDRHVTLSVNEGGADSIYLSGDIGRIRQILMNFVSNAIKYTPEGAVDMIVGPEKLDRLFDEFYMVEDVDTRAEEGTGLGLTIWKMGGKDLVQHLRCGKSPNADIPVIALTAMGDMGEAEELKDYGVDHVILKPFNAKDLINAIASQCKTIGALWFS